MGYFRNPDGELRWSFSPGAAIGQAADRFPTSGVDVLRAQCHKPQRVAQGCMLLLLFAALPGCASRAYNDLYIENMAAEIRDLEDQLYEYDHEYRILEQELQALRQQNSTLQQSLPGAPTAPKPHSEPYYQQDPNRPLEFYPGGSSVVPAPTGDSSSSEPQSILEPESVPAVESTDPAASAPGGQSSVLPGPAPDATTPRSPFPSNSSPNPSGDSGGDNEFDFNDFNPPTIEPGEPMPPPLPVVTDASSAGQQPSLELNLSRVEVPALLASQRREKSGGDDLGKSFAPQTGGATLQPAVEQVTDTRVVELVFHPSLSRAANFDDESDDDGLVLVLQPVNQRGQMVPQAADLSVVVLDPARAGDAARIGRWDYSAREVAGKIQRIGSGQGIHLTLPWNGPDPQADRVVVFARYTYENGRQVIGEKTIFVSNEQGIKTVWAPRGGAAASSVATAGARGSSNPGRPAQRSPMAGNPATTPAGVGAPGPSHVVRPASGIRPADPAPAPSSVQFR